jgi:DNA-binding response OmpR family regulator
MNPANQSQSSKTLACHNITLLTVSPNQEDRRSLESILDAPGWTIQGANSIREATRLLQDAPTLILCERDLPDGTWKDVFDAASGLDNPPPVVVVARSPDRSFWAEVLNLGGFDVLLKPFESAEVHHVMHAASRQTAAFA